MSQEFQTCPGCGRNIKPAGAQRICLYCGTEVPAAPARPVPAAPPIPQQGTARPGTRMPVPPQPGGTRMPVPPPASAPASPFALQPTAAPAPAPGAQQFPERMRANKALAGRVCMGCNKGVELGENVWNCQTCGTTMHQACHDQSRACLNMQCPTRAQALVATRTGTAALGGPARGGISSPVEAAGNPNEKPCPYCGEKILASAKKCRFCGEYLNPADRKLAEARQKAGSSDDTLSGSEILFGILCGNIACILGIIWMIQGKKKGAKLVGIALISSLVVGVLRAMAER